MSIFRRSDYTSDMTSFIDGLKAAKPTLEAEQRAGRAIWWDKNLNLGDQAEYGEARVAQQPYVYGSPAGPKGD